MAAPKTRKLSNTKGVTALGKDTRGPSRKLEAFPNLHPNRDTRVTFRCEEFTCLCPATGQPDFARLEIEYIPEAVVLESKSLKRYLWSYRDTRAFHEDVCNVILDELSRFLKPRWMQVRGEFFIRGGIAIDVVAEQDFREKG